MAVRTETGSSPRTADPLPADAGGRRRRNLLQQLPYALRVKLVTGLVVLAIWELFIRWFAPPYVARPTGIAAVIPDVLTDPIFIRSLGGTLIPILQGLFIATVLGVVIGLAMGQIRWLGWGLKLYTNALFAMPMIAVVPLITMWVGYTETARLLVVVFAAYFPMVINVYDGSRSVSRQYLEVAESFRAPRPAVWFGIVLPASLPYLLAGFRLAAGRVLVAAVVAEYIIAIDGLGTYILRNARSFRHDEAFVAVLVLALFGIATLVLARAGTRRFCPWYGKG